MITSDNLRVAAQRMERSTKVKTSDARRVLAVAVKMAEGKAGPQEISWAKRTAKGFMESRY